MQQFIVEMELPPKLSEEFLSKIPQQRAKVAEFLSTGKMDNYFLSTDRSKLWIILHATAETEVVDLLTRLPLTRYMEFEIHELLFHLSGNAVLPKVGMN